jgi:hypothetical protein
MKKILFVLFVLSAQQTWAQHAKTETLFSGNGKTTVGGYAAAPAKFTSIDGNLGVLTGGYGGVLLNHKIMLGVGAYSLVNNIGLPPVNPTINKEYLNLWYTGFVAEYTHNSDKLIHWTAGTLLGGGGVSRRDTRRRNDDFDQRNNYDGSGFFVAEPFANLELNITRFLRLDVGASYRYVQGSSTQGITDGKLSNPSVHVSIKAGKF